MPDLRTILRSLTPSHAVRNARRDVVEHARIVAEIDAIVQRLSDRPKALPAPPAATVIEEPRAS